MSDPKKVAAGRSAFSFLICDKRIKEDRDVPSLRRRRTADYRTAVNRHRLPVVLRGYSPYPKAATAAGQTTPKAEAASGGRARSPRGLNRRGCRRL